MDYFSELLGTMTWLGELPGVMFVGQAVEYPGTAMFTTLKHVPAAKRLELPVAEDFQLGFCTGLALQGRLPVCIYPRINFLLLAANQLVNHLDKLPLYSDYKPRVIIRTAIATEKPLDPGPQHLGDYTRAFSEMLDTVVIEKLWDAESIRPAYERAANRNGSTLLIERADLY